MNLPRKRILDCNGYESDVSITRNGKNIILKQGNDIVKIHASKLTMFRCLLKYAEMENIEWAMFDFENKR